MTNRRTLDARDLRMLNPLSAYAEAGAKAGKARRQHDEATAAFHTSWMRRAVALEHEDDRAAARDAFDSAYRTVATPPVSYFR